jgi:DNA (cytosine-5)-methyltransferase 1
MGVKPGLVTGLDLPYSAKMRILGNGVVPQQATTALQLLVRMACRIETRRKGQD